MCPSTPPWRKKSWPARQRAARGRAVPSPAGGKRPRLPGRSGWNQQRPEKGGFVLTLRDGTAIDLMECDTDFRTYGYSYKGGELYIASFDVTFTDLIALGEMESLSFCGVDIPLDFSGA